MIDLEKLKAAALAATIEELRVKHEIACQTISMLQKRLDVQQGALGRAMEGIVTQSAIAHSIERAIYSRPLCDDALSHELLYIIKSSNVSDSKAILAEWLDKQLGEPFLYQYEYVFNINSDSQGLPYEKGTVTKFSATLPKGGVDIIHLFKKPEIK